MRSLLRGLRFMVGYGPAAGPSKTVAGGGAVSFDEIRAAIDAAMIVEREPDDDGPRVAVISPSLRGSFFWSRDAATRRIEISFPGTDPDVVKRAVRHLENVVRVRTRPPGVANRRGWVHSWKED